MKEQTLTEQWIELKDRLIAQCKYSRIPLGEISNWDGLVDFIEAEIEKAKHELFDRIFEAIRSTAHEELKQQTKEY